MVTRLGAALFAAFGDFSDVLAIARPLCFGASPPLIRFASASVASEDRSPQLARAEGRPLPAERRLLDHALSWRAMNALTVSRALSVCGPSWATHSCTEFSNRRNSQLPPAAL